MKKTLILGLAVAGIALSPISAFAAQDDKYPAANFEPKVVFIDEDAVKPVVVAAQDDGKYPAANFQPKVVFIDEQAAAQATAKKPDIKIVHDPKYPAAYFEPKVIYP
jgi:hypothetical protein